MLARGNSCRLEDGWNTHAYVLRVWRSCPSWISPPLIKPHSYLTAHPLTFPSCSSVIYPIQLLTLLDCGDGVDSVICGSCDPWTVARQIPLSMGFSRQAYGRGFASSILLLQGIFLTQGSNPCLLHHKQTLDHGAIREAPGCRLCSLKSDILRGAGSCSLLRIGSDQGRASHISARW